MTAATLIGTPDPDDRPALPRLHPVDTARFEHAPHGIRGVRGEHPRSFSSAAAAFVLHLPGVRPASTTS